MRIKANCQKLIRESSELLNISRQIRRCSSEIEGVRARLSGYTQLDEAKRELKKQTESAELITARLVLLSTALQDIASLYDRREGKNLDGIEEYRSPFRARDQMWVTSIPNEFKEKFRELF